MAIWKNQDETRVKGAAGALQDAAYLSSNFEDQGPCPLTAVEIKDTIKLAEGAITLLKRIKHPTS